MDYKYYLNLYFGYDSFRGIQEEVVESLLSKKDTIAIMKTGGGKSICFQVPALINDGLTIVITPLISLMVDQVRELKENKIKAAYLNSNMDNFEMKNVYNSLNKMKLLYVSPERLLNSYFMKQIDKVKVSQIIVDEAHCASTWGDDFRKSYLDIKDFISRFKDKPVVGAFTATANKKIIEDIISALGLKNPNIINTTSERSNLYYSIKYPKDKITFLIKYLSKKRDDKTLIYVLTRRQTESLSKALIKYGFSVSSYHGGMEKEDKDFAQKSFTNGTSKVMIATNAFGMGINIPDIKNVILFEIPQSLEDLSQEWGRAARNGDKGECILLYDSKDIKTVEFLIDKSLDKEVIKSKYLQFKKVLEFVDTSLCLHNFINSYFGYKSDKKCNNCSNCCK